ncbi:GrpB family protein [Gordonia sp. NPDC058843]|uniref:GrpB family protein n=1 Tax=Gordonia sp. NPDC058843 TaxID=3346648 RepID=UPI0036B65564
MRHTREGRHVLGDGRKLAWSAHGSDSGTPVLFLAGAASGRTMLFGTDVLDELDVTLVTVDRPGMGESDHHDGRTLQSTAEDLADFASTWGGPLPVVANSQGAPFGLACAALGVARRLVLVSPVDEIAVQPCRSTLSEEMRAMVDTVQEDPGAAERMFAALGPDGMEDMVIGSAGDEDRRIFTQSEFLDMYRRALREGFASGGVGYAVDTRIAMSPWALSYDEIRCDVHVLTGGRDRHHTTDFGAGLTARVDSATRTVVDGAGGALLWTHARYILEMALGGPFRPTHAGFELIGGPEQRPIVLEPSSALWPRRFDAERRRIRRALGDRALRIDHIGSTAVPGLPAKPIVDIDVSVGDPEDEDSYLPALVEAGYRLRVREPGHRMLRTPDLDVHVHVCQAGGNWERRHLLFRDWLRVDARDRNDYAELKRLLAQQDWADMNQYAAAKGPLIASITERAESWATRAGWQVSTANR